MTRQRSAAIGTAVLLIVVAATTALALNAGFVNADSGASSATVEDIPVTTTTTYEQYLEDYYAANPTSTAVTSSTVPAEPVVIYEYLDVPVTVPEPRIIYVPVESPAGTTGGSEQSGGPAEPTTTRPSSTTRTPSSTTAPPSTSPPTTTVASAPELLVFDLYGFAEVTVASYGPGDRLQFWEIDTDSPWVWEIEDDTGDKAKVEFFDPATDREAKFELEIKSDGRLRLKTEGSGFPSAEEYV